MSWVYFIQHGGPGGAIKIGTTTGNPHARLRALQTGAPEPLRMLAAIPGDARIERALHERFAALRVRADGEWFRAEPVLLGFIDGARFSAGEQPDDDGDDWEDPPADGFHGLTEGQVDALWSFVCGLVARERFYVAMRGVKDAAAGHGLLARHVEAFRAAVDDLRTWTVQGDACTHRALINIGLEHEAAKVEAIIASHLAPARDEVH